MALPTVTVRLAVPEDVLASPLKAAETGMAPVTPKVAVQTATPFTRGTAAHCGAGVKVTVPPMGTACPATATVAVRVTGWPIWAVVANSPTRVGAWATTTGSGVAVDGW